MAKSRIFLDRLDGRVWRAGHSDDNRPSRFPIGSRVNFAVGGKVGFGGSLPALAVRNGVTSGDGVGADRGFVELGPAWDREERMAKFDA